jgi:hypothetical protein
VLVFIFSSYNHSPLCTLCTSLHVFKMQIILFFALVVVFSTIVVFRSTLVFLFQVAPLLFFALDFMFSSCSYLPFCIGLLIFNLHPSFSLHWSSCFQAMTNFQKCWSSSQIAPLFFGVVFMFSAIPVLFTLVFMFSSYNHPPLCISLVVGLVTSHPLLHSSEKMSPNYLDQTFHLIKMSNVFVKWVHMVRITNRHLCYYI